MSMQVDPISLETVITEMTGLAPDGGQDSVRTLGDDALDGLGQLSVSPAVPGAGTVQTVRHQIASSIVRETARTPAAGLRIRVISVSMHWGNATFNNLEIYFGTGANIGTNPTSAIHNAGLDLDTGSNQDSMVWPDGGGPVGAADEVLSVRAAISVAANASWLVHTREE